MATDISASIPLPPLAQIGFVVPSMDLAIASLSPLFGPFNRMRYVNVGYDFRGQLADSTVDVAFGFSGEIEIELIQPISGNGPHREFIESGKSGLHHFQYRFANIDETVERFLHCSYECIWHKRESADTAVAYMIRSDVPVAVELVEPLIRVRP